MPTESVEPWVSCSNSPAISCGYSWLAAAGVLVAVLGAAVAAVGVAAVETAGMCREGGHGWAVKKGVGCMLQGHLVPDLEQRKARQGWYLGERGHDLLPGVRVGSGRGMDPGTPSCTASRSHHLLSKRELPSKKHGVSRLQAKSLV